MGAFPVYEAEKDAKCFRCGAVLAQCEPSEYAVGQGAHRGRCLTCEALCIGAITYFDLKVEVNDKRAAPIKDLP